LEPDNVKSMEKLFKEADMVILQPIPEDRRVETTKRIMEAIHQAKVKMVVLMSFAGCEDNDHNLKSLREFYEIEKDFRKFDFKCWTIVRPEFPQDWLLLWSPYVENNGTLPLSTGREQQFPPIRMQDVTCALKEIIKRDIEEVTGGQGKHHGQCYHLTGPETMNQQKCVEELNRGISSNVQVKTEPVDRNRMEEILRELRDRRQVGGCEQAKAAGQQQPVRATEKCDRVRAFQGQPTDKQIQTLCDYFEHVKNGNADKVTHDLKKLTGRDGCRIEGFFKDNADHFTPNRGRQL